MCQLLRSCQTKVSLPPIEMESEKNELWESERLEKMREGDHVSTPGGDISKQMPPWFDITKFDRAKKIYRNYFASVNFSHLCGLLMSFYFTKNIKTLKSTGESDTKASLLHRYLQTIRHIQKWYEGNVFDIDDPAYRSLSIVRAMHARAGKRMSLLNDGVVYVSQWDMALTQWAFVAPMVLFKSRVGLHGLNDDDYDALMHFWRSIGYLLGIKDEYNLCHGDYIQVVSTCKMMFLKEYKVQMAAASPISVSMGKSVVNALQQIDHLLTWNSISTYIHELMGIPCPEKMNFVDSICHYVMRFFMLFVAHFSSSRQIFNDLTRWRLDMADKKDLKLLAASSNTIGG